jgi:hypothetical protein
MRALSLEPKVISLANTLMIEATDAVAGVRDYCARHVQRFISAAGPISDIRELQRVVCEKLNLVIHEVWSDAQLQQITNSYAAGGEAVFAFLPADLDAGTYGVLVRLHKRVGKKFAWAALVDCRGDKRHRRFFTAWHEIVHCITAADQYELPFHRTIIGKKFTDPLERLVDLVAGDLAFFDSLFRPHLEQAFALEGRLTFSAIERIRDQFCPDASFEATLNACVTRLDSPLMFLKAGMILKDSEQAALDSPQRQLFQTPAPSPKLRVVSTVRNTSARKVGLHIPLHFRVPESSIIASANSCGLGRTIDSVSPENLSTWTSSDGNTLPPITVNVTARKISDHVFTLISLAIDP